MSVAEIIEQIKTLPPEEQMQVFAFVREAEMRSASASAFGVKYADDQTIEAIAERIFERHEELFKKLAE